MRHGLSLTMTPVSRICLASARPGVLALISVILEIEVKFADVIHMDNIHILQFFVYKWISHVFERRTFGPDQQMGNIICFDTSELNSSLLLLKYY